MFMYRKIKVSVGIVPMPNAECRIPNTYYLLPVGHHVLERTGSPKAISVFVDREAANKLLL